MRAHELTTPDGRTLAVLDTGDPDGAPIVVHHGTPSAATLFDGWARPGIRLIGFDRAGYGGSTRAAGRDVGHVAADVSVIADALGLERFATWGISGGGPHALACAALCDERLVAVASLAGVAPWGADGLDWLAGMGESNLEEFDLALTGEEVLQPALETWRAAMLAGTPETFFDELASLLGDADRAALTGDLAAWMLASVQRGLADSSVGWVDDDLAFTRPWGFGLTAIERPVLIVHGGDDRFVPIAHGRWLAEQVAGAEVWIDETDGHLTLQTRHVPGVHDWLLERF